MRSEEKERGISKTRLESSHVNSVQPTKLLTHIDTESYKINTPDGCNIAYFDSSVRLDDTLMCSPIFLFFSVH